MGDTKKKVGGGDKQNEVWMQFEAKNTRILVKRLPRSIYDELDEKETFWGLAPAAIGELRRSDYDQAVRFYTTRYDKWRDQEASKRTQFQKAQGWFYLQMCSSFTKTNLVKIQQYEASKFRKDVMARNPTFLIDSPEVIYLPHGSLCYQVLKHEYVSSGPTSLIIQLTGWNKLVGSRLFELLKKHPESKAILKFVQEGEQSWAMLESFYNQLDPDTIASVQLLMAVHAASSETVRLSCQELIKELVGGKKMKVSDLVKKLTVIAKFNEADDHLNAHAQRNGGGSRKKQLDSIVSVNSVHQQNSQVKKCNRCGVDFVPDKASYRWCNNCHQSTVPGKLELTDGANKKFNEKKRLKQKKQFAKDKAGKLKKKGVQSQGKKISANVATAASDSESERSASSADSGLSLTSGLASNPANREIASSSGASEHQDIFFFDFFSIFF